MANRYFMNSRLGIAIASLILLPTIWYVGFQQSSYALGTLAAAVIVLGLSVQEVWNNWRGRLVQPVGKGRVLIMLVLCGFVCQSIGAIASAVDFDFARFGESSVGVLILFVGGVSVASLFDGTSECTTTYTLHGAAWSLILMAFFGVLDCTPLGHGSSQRALFIFSEPSHFVLMFAPFLLWAVVKSQGVLLRVVLFAAVLVLLLLIKNMTFLALIGLAALVALRTRALSLVAACLIAIIALHPTYFLSRLNFSDTSYNLSALVWLQGWQNVYSALKSTDGLGLGFQQLGLHGAHGDAALLIARQMKVAYGIDHGTMNLLDGGTLGAKLSAEFGVLGIVLVIVCSWLILRSVFRLRMLARIPDAPAGQVFFYCCIASFALDLFIRGTGYFGPWVLLSLAGFYGASQLGKSKRGTVVPIMTEGKVPD